MTGQEREEWKTEILRHCAKKTGRAGQGIDGSSLIEEIMSKAGTSKEEARELFDELIGEGLLREGRPKEFYLTEDGFAIGSRDDDSGD
jgi:predicted transcriptional regulator